MLIISQFKKKKYLKLSCYDFFDWYAEASKQNSDSKIVFLKDSLTKGSKESDKLQKQQIRLISQ